MSDPLIRTPSAVKGELDRVRGVLDTVNAEVSAATAAGQITSAEWNQWRQAYLAGHDFVDNASTLWGSNVATARQHEQEAGKWHDLVKSRGGQTQGPTNLIRQPDGGSPFSINITTLLLVGGGAVAAIYAMRAMRRVGAMAGASRASITDNRYDKPFRYVKRHRAYLVTLQKQTKSQPVMYDVTPEHGDRAIPKGIIEKGRRDDFFHAYLYVPGYAGRYDKARRLDLFPTLDAAIAAILEA